MSLQSIQRFCSLSKLSSLGLLGVISACAGAPSADLGPGEPEAAAPSVALTQGELRGPNGEALRALATIDLEQDHNIRIFEPTPGALSVLEARLPSQQPVWERETSDVLELFARFKPQQALPVELVEAYERSLELQHAAPSVSDVLPEWGAGSAADTASAPAQPAGNVGVIASALTASSNPAGFVNGGGCAWGSSWSTCKVNWGNGYYAYATGTKQTCDVCPYSGNGVRMVMKVNGAVAMDVGISGCSTLTTTGASTTRRLEVNDASGDAFHAGCRWTK